jgi:hypothetical protein
MIGADAMIGYALERDNLVRAIIQKKLAIKAEKRPDKIYGSRNKSNTFLKV